VQVYISVDMEGVTGIATADQVVRGGHAYPLAQRLMTAEANAAIEGAFAGGAERVVVNDSHGSMDNLLHEELDPRARLIFGTPKLDCMAEGLSATTPPPVRPACSPTPTPPTSSGCGSTAGPCRRPR
jgi:D-amino peptidase